MQYFTDNNGQRWKYDGLDWEKIKKTPKLPAPPKPIRNVLTK